MVAKINDGLTAKQRHALKKFENAEMIDCACGCGEQLKAFDKYARPASFINGHNARKYEGTAATKTAATMRWKAKRPDKVREAKVAFYRKRKILAMKIKGNACTFCGLEYDGTNAAKFEFHHSDPAVKESIISKMLINKAWETTLKELEVCVMTCANCHNHHHSPGW